MSASGDFGQLFIRADLLVHQSVDSAGLSSGLIANVAEDILGTVCVFFYGFCVLRCRGYPRWNVCQIAFRELATFVVVVYCYGHPSSVD